MPQKKLLEKMLQAAPKRSLRSTLFNVAHAYARAANYSLQAIGAEKDADFAAPAIMCQSFAIELLLKFFLAIDHPNASTTDQLKAAGVKLKCHKYSELFDQLQQQTKDKSALAYADVIRQSASAEDFRQALLAQGDDPFVYWRYIYETQDRISHFDTQAFVNVLTALGKAAEAERKAAPNA